MSRLLRAVVEALGLGALVVLIPFGSVTAPTVSFPRTDADILGGLHARQHGEPAHLRASDVRISADGSMAWVECPRESHGIEVYENERGKWKCVGTSSANRVASQQGR